MTATDSPRTREHFKHRLLDALEDEKRLLRTLLKAIERVDPVTALSALKRAAESVDVAKKGE